MFDLLGTIIASVLFLFGIIWIRARHHRLPLYVGANRFEWRENVDKLLIKTGTRSIRLIDELESAVNESYNSPYGYIFQISMPVIFRYFVVTNYKVLKEFIQNPRISQPKIFDYQNALFDTINTHHLLNATLNGFPLFNLVMSKHINLDDNDHCVEMSEIVNRLVYDVSTILYWNKCLHCLHQRRDALILMTINNVLLNYKNMEYFIPYKKYLPWSVEYTKYKDAKNQLIKLFEEHKILNNIQKNTITTNNNDTIFDNFSLSKYLPTQLSQSSSQIMEANSQVMESSHYIANVLNSLLLEISTDNRIKMKVQDELDTYLPSVHSKENSNTADLEEQQDKDEQDSLEMIATALMSIQSESEDIALDMDPAKTSSAQQDRLDKQDRLDRVMESVQEAWNHLQTKFPYLSACIDETMRLWPPYGIGTVSTLGSAHTVSVSRESDLDHNSQGNCTGGNNQDGGGGGGNNKVEYNIPNHSYIHAARYSMYRQPFLHKSKQFVPERWLPHAAKSPRVPPPTPSSDCDSVSGSDGGNTQKSNTDSRDENWNEGNGEDTNRGGETDMAIRESTTRHNNNHMVIDATKFTSVSNPSDNTRFRSQLPDLLEMKSTFVSEIKYPTPDSRYAVMHLQIFVLASLLLRYYDFTLASNITVNCQLMTLKVGNMKMKVQKRSNLG